MVVAVVVWLEGEEVREVVGLEEWVRERILNFFNFFENLISFLFWQGDLLSIDEHNVGSGPVTPLKKISRSNT